MRALSGIAGKKFGHLLALEQVPHPSRRRMWRLLCDCGKEIVAVQFGFTSGSRTSCGCQGRQTVRHGKSAFKEYNSWVGMRSRCGNPKDRQFHRYGGCGIKVCEAWRVSFEQFFKDVGPKPTEKHSLDRYPNNAGNYEPGNVRWATQHEQMQNARNNVMVVLDGTPMTLIAACKLSDADNELAYNRVQRHGWDLAPALSMPKQTHQIRARDTVGRWI